MCVRFVPNRPLRLGSQFDPKAEIQQSAPRDTQLHGEMADELTAEQAMLFPLLAGGELRRRAS